MFIHGSNKSNQSNGNARIFVRVIEGRNGARNGKCKGTHTIITNSANDMTEIVERPLEQQDERFVSARAYAQRVFGTGRLNLSKYEQMYGSYEISGR